MKQWVSLSQLNGNRRIFGVQNDKIFIAPGIVYLEQGQIEWPWGDYENFDESYFFLIEKEDLREPR